MDPLVPIGRFSKMTRLSIKALRRYDESGLLIPDWVDPSSGYRYYGFAQANRAEAIRLLRSIDMPLAEIVEVLDAGDDSAGKLLDVHRARLEERLAEQERMLAFLETLIAREGGVMPYDIEVIEVPPQQVASIRVTTSLRDIGGDIESGFGRLMGHLSPRGIAPAAPPLLVFHDVIDEETKGDVEICIPVAGEIEGEGDIVCRELPGGAMAATTHHGPYREISPAYHTLMGWIQDHGHEIAGPPREIYLNDPREVGEAEQLTAVHWPIS